MSYYGEDLLPTGLPSLVLVKERREEKRRGFVFCIITMCLSPNIERKQSEHICPNPKGAEYEWSLSTNILKGLYFQVLNILYHLTVITVRQLDIKYTNY